MKFTAVVDAQILDESEVQLLTVSDGLDDLGAMTFGWIIALPCGRRLARCGGPAYGPYGSSFCAEGYGFLSITRFLVRLCEFCDIKPKWSIQMMTDNQGLITRITTSLPHDEPFPNLTLLSDWDVTNEISQSLCTFQREPILGHVKGHQDSHTHYDALPLDAQLNVDADTAAGAYQCMHPMQRPIIPCIQSNSVQLHISGKVICSRIKQRIREAATVPTYLAYVSKRFKWDPSVANTIDWQAYTQMIG
jgi:hypothetical protein